VDRFSRHLSRARGALDLGDALVDTIRPSRREVAIDAAFAAYGQGLFWALTAETTGDLPPRPEDAWDAAPPDLLAETSANGEIARGRQILARPLGHAAEASEAERIAEVDALRSLLHELIHGLRRRRPSSRDLARRRWTRVALVAMIALLPILLVARHLGSRDLAAGKRWITSSFEADCDVSMGICQGSVVNLAFHTKLEDAPWATLDLGSVQAFTSMVVVNRRDCCGDRAVPLIVETCADGVHFTKLAEKRELFTEWTVRFPEVRARYVRLRVPHQTAFHLERVSIR